MKFVKNNFKPLIISFVIFLISAIYITFPLIFNLGSLITGYGDQYLHVYVMNWIVNIIFTNPLSLFDGTIYYPFINPIAYSDIFITSSVLGIIPLLLIQEPVSIVNFTLISSIFMVGFFTFILSFYLTKNFWASLVSGLLIIFSPLFLDKKTHIQILSIQWVPLAILFFIIFVNNLKSRYLFLSLLFFLFQFYNSFLPGYFISFFYAIYLIFSFFKDKKLFKNIVSKNNLLILVFFIILIIPIIKPYIDVDNKYYAKRDIRDSIHFALQPEDLIYPNEHTVLEPILLEISNWQKYLRTDEIKSGYMGLMFSVLGVFVIFYSIKKFRILNIVDRSFFITGILGLILSFGPALHFARQTIHSPFPIILPYALFYYIIPGFNGFRNSARWEILFMFCMAILISLTLSLILKNFKKAWIIYIILIFGIVAEYNFPMKFYKVLSINNFPKVYQWMNTTSKDSVFVLMPIYNWNSPNSYIELERQYFYTKNFRKVINGYSGFSPLEWQENVLFFFNDFPNTKSLEKLKNIGVDYVIVNIDEYNNLYKNKYYRLGDGNFVISSLNKSSIIFFKEKIGQTYIYSFNK
ncbi:MAG: hypothetical protein AAB532_03300 [Patescibacteria group bacterium]